MDLERHWRLEPGLDFLNHGSFGACPGVVLDAQQALRGELEAQPVDFFVRRLSDRLDAAREKLAAFLRADPEGLVAVANATSGVNAVLRSLRFESGDEILTTDHEYNACRNVIDFVADRDGARAIAVELPFPSRGAEEVTEAILARASERTAIAVLDHVTSPTGLVMPLETLVRRLAERGIDTLVDGAHAPGMLDLDIDSLGAAYYSGNCHKWLCAPKGAAFLWVRADRRERVRPLTISHGANSPRPGRSRLHDEFDWMGTSDPTAFLCVPDAIECMRGLVDGGWPEIRKRNRDLAVTARRTLAGALGVEPPAPEAMIGSLASLPLPDGSGAPPASPLYTDPLQETLRHEHGIEVPVIPWPGPPKRLVRISAQLYNSLDQYDRLAAALRRLLDR